MEFEYPAVLFFLIPIILWSVWWYKRGYSSLGLVISLPGRDSKKTFRRTNLGSGLFLFRIISIMSLVVAIAGPGTTQKLLPEEKYGIDIMLAIDVSGSMARSRDFLPESRLGVSKRLLSSFIDKRENDRLGLVVFAGAAYVQSPLTSDRHALRNILASIEEETVPEQGTAIGDALIHSTYRLKDSQARSKVIVLLTDGVSNTGRMDPDTAGAVTKDFGIKIYTIGIGKEESSFEINFGMLQKLSDLTGGLFFRAETPDQLQGVLESIDSLEKDLLEGKTEPIVESYFWKFVVWASIFLSVDLLLRTFLYRYQL